MRLQLETALDDIRISLQADGGDVELVGVDDGIVKLKLHGACQKCPGIHMTLAMTIEPVLKERVPGVRAVVTV